MTSAHSANPAAFDDESTADASAQIPSQTYQVRSGKGDREKATDETDERADVEAQESRADRPNVSPYSHGFWDRELVSMRKTYLLGIARITIAITILIWAVVTIYWGSLWKANDKSPNIDAFIVNRDQGVIGSNITNALMASKSGSVPHLNWVSVDPSRYPSDEAIEHGIAVKQDAWILVDILADATVRLDQARSSTNASWDPTQVVRIFYSEARNQQAVDGVILGSVRGVLVPVVAQINTNNLARWLATNAADSALITTLAQQAPQTLAGAVATKYINLRPWDEPVSIAPTFVGLIYAMILAFNITMGNFGMRQGIQRQLRFRSLVLMRLLVPMVAYLILSCMFSMINLPFKLGFGGMGLGYGAGFMIWWCFTFLGMSVLGLYTEAALSLVGPPFIGFALVFFIIINVSVANLPIELQVSLFQYGYAMPFYNLRQAYVMIIYNTGRHVDLLKYMGVLLAWLVVLFLTLPVWIWLERRTERKAAMITSSQPQHSATSPTSDSSHADLEKKDDDGAKVASA